MMEFLVYDLKVAVCVAVFYMFFRLMLSRETLHRMNRMVLLATAVVSFILPLCVVTIHHTVVVPQVTSVVTAEMPMIAVLEDPSQPLWQQFLIAAFFAGVAVTLGHLLWSVCQVVRLIRRSEQHPQSDGTVVCVADKDVSPFSWMRYIVLSRQDYEQKDPAIMAHERGHIRQCHSLDVVLVDTLTVLQWFNPAMWMLRQDLRAIHEYEADAAVLSQGINMRQYQYLLIQKAVATCGYSVANGITHSTLKNRINMMLTNKKSTSKSWLKVLALLPIVGVALALNAETVNDYVYQQPQKKVVKKGRKSGKIKVGGKTIEVKAEEPQEKAEATPVPNPVDDVKIILGEAGGHEPLLVIDGKVSTREQLQAIDQKAIDHINVVKASEDNKDLRRVYGDKFNADTSNGIIFIITKEYAKSDERKKDYVVVVKSKDKEEEAKDDKVFNVVEQLPEFPGGMGEMMKFLSMNVKYPESAKEAGRQGRVIVQFVVEKDGSISSAKILKSVSPELDAEALRVVNVMPKWTPGMQKGQPARVRFTLPIAFRLQGNEKKEGEKKEADDSPVKVITYPK